jgi:hypothetical protein
MSRPEDTTRTPTAPALSALFARYVERQSAAHAAGVGPAETTGEVVPYEAVPVQPVDARLAWHEVQTGLGILCPAAEVASCPAPPEWSNLVQTLEPAAAVPMAACNFPQLVRNIQPLLHVTEWSRLRPALTRPLSVPGLVEWATAAERRKSRVQTLVAAGCLRVARQFGEAGALLESQAPRLPADWQAAWDNERAALTWQRGDAEAAAALWQAQGETPAVLFNRGMASLFLGRPGAARPWLSKAVDQLPEADGWHHLGRLYLAVAEMRG